MKYIKNQTEWILTEGKAKVGDMSEDEIQEFYKTFKTLPNPDLRGTYLKSMYETFSKTPNNTMVLLNFFRSIFSDLKIKTMKWKPFLAKTEKGEEIINYPDLIINGSFNIKNANPILVHKGELIFSIQSVAENIQGHFTGLENLKGFPKHVPGFIDIWCNLQTLEGSLETVGKTFKITGGNLPSLVGGPVSVGGDYIVEARLESLKGCCSEIKGNLVVSNNKLKDLEGCPGVIQGGLYVSNNQLESLKGFAHCKCATLVAWDNQLKTLQGLPLTIKDVIVAKNPIETLEGLPAEVNKLHLENSELADLKGIPNKIHELIIDYNKFALDFTYMPQEVLYVSLKGSHYDKEVIEQKFGHLINKNGSLTTSK